MKNNKDVDSLSHTTWRCQYHVVFAPKYRRMVIYGQIKKDIGQILRKLCEQKDIEIIEAESLPGPYPYADKFFAEVQHFLRYGISQGKEQPIFDRHANLKYKYGNRHFWARGYFVDAKESRLCKRWCRKYAVAFLYKKKNVKSYDLTFKIWCTSRDSNPGPTD